MMKEIFILSVFSFLTFATATAQTQKGSQNLGISVGLQVLNHDWVDNINNETYTTKDNNFYIEPNYGFFVADKLELGVGVGYGNAYTTNPTFNNVSQVNKTRYSSYIADIYLNKYVLFTDNFGLRTGPSFRYTRSSAKIENASTNTTYKDSGNSYYGALNLELVYYPIKRLGLAGHIADLGYTYMETPQTSDTGTFSTTTKGFLFNLVNQFNISVFLSF